MTKGARQKRDLHALDKHGMVLCNPRDKEAAHRAEMEGIATYDTAAVTCPQCVRLLHQQQRDRRSSTSRMTSSNSSQEDDGATVSAGGITAGAQPSTDSSKDLAASPPSTDSHFRRTRDIDSVVAEIRPGDGVDPREEKLQRLRMGARQKPDLASERLRSQIFDALRLSTLLAEIGLEDFTFAGVTPTGRGGRFLVDVCCADPDAKFEPREIENILQEKKGLFRTEVSQSINRRKAPELRFRVLPPGFRP